MKKLHVILTVFGLICCLALTRAQTNGGDFLIGGSTNLNFGYYSEVWEDNYGTAINQGDVRGITLGLSPLIGVFVIKGLAIGLELPFSFSSGNYSNGDKSNSFDLAAAPFIRYYFNVPKVKPFLHTQFGYGFYNFKRVYDDALIDDYTLNGHTLSYKFGAGVAIFLTEKLSLDIMLGYSSTKYDADNNLDDTFSETDKNLGLDLGFNIVL